MNLSFPLSQPSWTKQTHLLVSESEENKEKDITQLCYKVKQKISETHHIFSPRIMDSGISFDCSWKCRGWQANEGVNAAIVEKTGKVMYIVHKSLFLPAVQKKQNERDEEKMSSISYMEWFMKHEKHCLLNHVGSSQSMKSYTVMALYKCFVKKRGLFHDPFIEEQRLLSKSRSF